MTRRKLYILFMAGYTLGRVLKASDEELEKVFKETIEVLNG